MNKKHTLTRLDRLELLRQIASLHVLSAPVGSMARVIRHNRLNRIRAALYAARAQATP